MKRVFWILITPTIVIALLWFATDLWIQPQVEKWVLNKIETLSESKSPVRVRAEGFSFKIFKPSVTLSKIELQGQGELKAIIEKIEVERVRVFIDYFDLIAGRLNISAIAITSPVVHLNLDPVLKDTKAPQKLPIDALFDHLEGLPLDRVFLRDIQLSLKAPSQNWSVIVDGGELALTNKEKNINAKANLPEIVANLGKIGSFAAAIDSHLFLNRKSLKIVQFSVQHGESEVSVRGEITPIANVTVKPAGLIAVTTRLNLEDANTELAKIFPDKKLPSVSGALRAEVEARLNGMDRVTAKASIQSNNFIFDKFELGDARIEGEFKENTISFSEFQVSHPSGDATIKKSKLFLSNDLAFSAEVATDNLDLYKLFKSLNLGNIPVGVDISARLPCSGKIRPSFELSCSQGEIHGKNLWVHTGFGPQETSILDLESLSARGSVHVTMDSVSYTAALQVGDSVGQSEGVIDYHKGFKINFATKSLDFKNVKNLAHLHFSGQAGIEGQTSGNASTAQFSMKVNARNFVFERFHLGNLISDLSFKKSVLYFQNLAGSIGKSQYLGDLDVDLHNMTLDGEFSAPSTDLNDIAFVFDNIYRFPFTVRGSGAVKARVSGPLSLWKMNYKLDSAFQNVSIGSENFNSLDVNFTGLDGNLQIEKALLKKNQSTLQLRGGISSRQIFDIQADAKNWKLEESDIISSINSNIVGTLNFAAQFQDSVYAPVIKLNGSITDTYFEEHEIPNSNFAISLNTQSLNTQLSLFGNRVTALINYPFSKNTTPLVLKVNTSEWNYSNLLGLIGGASLANDYDSKLTAKIDLTSPSGELFKASGSVNIEHFALQRGDLAFANKEPIEILADNGRVSFKNFHLEGPGNYLQIKGDNFTAENLNVNLNSRANLHLLHIFLPFLEDLGGQVQFSTTVSGSVAKPQILGNLTSRNAFIKIKGLPHPIERLSLDAAFSQSKVLINGIQGQIAGGTVTGEGGILINGIRDLPTSIRLGLENVTMNVPDRVRSTGNADLLFSGNWFPFTLSGTYRIQNAFIDKEFTEDAGGVTGVRQSYYLPKGIKEGNFQPLFLDIQLVMERNIIVKNSLIDGSVNGQLQVKGTPDSPILLGRINLDRKSKLIFKDKIFEIQNGLIEFNDPNEINPNLYINALSRINDYDITLLTQGSAKNLIIRLTSVPPLPEQDIISLIALGVTSSAMDQNVQSRQQAEQLGVEIGGAVLAKPISKQLENTIGFNFQVTSEYDSIRNITVPKVTLSRYLSDKVKVSGGRPVRESQSYDIKLEYLFNNNMTAIGSFENRGIEEEPSLQGSQQEAQSIFGLDLEFKWEFK
ncbi:hypothetical protein BDW_09205 [Bdellovibrio bacteriovorus W]|nr:hypothetical protein BDW_09205 [Bdellovibrio bacteriovorus W]